MFFVKKWLGSLLAPLPLGLGVAVAGLFFLWFSRRQRSGRILVTLGVAGLLLCSIGPLVNLLHGNLETRYPPYNIKDVPEDFRPAYIVVLGAGARPDARLPSTAQIGSNSLARLIEGIRIFRQNPGSRLLLSGVGKVDRITPSADWRAFKFRVRLDEPVDIRADAHVVPRHAVVTHDGPYRPRANHVTRARAPDVHNLIRRLGGVDRPGAAVEACDFFSVGGDKHIARAAAPYTGEDPPERVNLDGQFGLEPFIEVGPARMLCAPALKEVVSPDPEPAP